MSAASRRLSIGFLRQRHVAAHRARSGVSYDGPYELAGVAGLGGIGITLALTPNFLVLGEIAATFGYIEAHPHGDQDLTVSIRNPAMHAQLGIGYRF